MPSLSLVQITLDWDQGQGLDWSGKCFDWGQFPPSKCVKKTRRKEKHRGSFAPWIWLRLLSIYFIKLLTPQPHSLGQATSQGILITKIEKLKLFLKIQFYAIRYSAPHRVFPGDPRTNLPRHWCVPIRCDTDRIKSVPYSRCSKHLTTMLVQEWSQETGR